jgi:hypothetical protein
MAPLSALPLKDGMDFRIAGELLARQYSAKRLFPQTRPAVQGMGLGGSIHAIRQMGGAKAVASVLR